MALSVEPQRSVRIGVGTARVQACLEWATTFLEIFGGEEEARLGKHTERACGGRSCIILQNFADFELLPPPPPRPWYLVLK